MGSIGRYFAPWGVAILAGFIFGLVAFNAVSAPIGVTGSWRYSIDGDGKTTRGMFQAYSVDFSKLLTNAVTVSGNVRYTHNWNDGKVSTLLAPLVNIGVNNDLFHFNVAASSNKRKTTGSATYFGDSVSASWSSAWKRKIWLPDLMFSYGKNWNYDDASPRTMNTKSEHAGTNIHWSYLTTNIYYNFNWNKNTDSIYNTSSTSKNHFVKFQTSHSFWHRRISTAFSQQFMYNTVSSYAQSIGGNQYLVRLTVSQLYAGSDSTPTTGTLPVFTSPFTVNGTSYANLGLQVNNKAVNYVYVYTDTDISSLNPDTFTWDVYTSSDGTNWTKQISGASFTYNSVLKRFEINTNGLKDVYIKVVLNPWGLSTQTFSVVDLRAYEIVTSSSSKFTSISRNYITNFTLSYRIFRGLTASYNLYRRSNNISNAPTYTNTINSASLSWSYSKYFSPIFSISQTNTSSGAGKTMIRSYSISTISHLLPTLYLNFIASRSNNYKDSKKQATTNYFTLNSNIQIYPDLTSNLRFGFTDTKDFLANTRTETLNTGIDMTARLTPKLTLGFNGNYDDTVKGGDNKSYTSMVNLTWRPSNILSLRTNCSRTWSQGSPATDGAGLNVSVAPTNKIQTSGGYQWSESAGNTSQRFTLAMSWAITNHFNFNSSGYFDKMSTENTWGITGQLVARF